MSQPNDPRTDELRDRLMDQALREVLGGETPPDLSDRILAAVAKQGSLFPKRKEHVMDKPKRRARWIVGTVAVCLVAGVAVALVLPALQPARESASRTLPMRPQADTAARESVDYAAAEDAAEATMAEPTPDDPSGLVLPPIVQQIPNLDVHVVSGSGPRPSPTEAPSSTAAPTAAPPWRFSVGSDDSASPSSNSPLGVGPGQGGDQYGHLGENPFRTVKDHQRSTFSIDVDTASYSNVRRFLLNEHRLPPPDAVRIEELVNYFDYDYAGPTDDVPFASHIAAAGCPWAPAHRLVRVALKGKVIQNEDRPESNLVFLIDVSGSMNSPDKLPLVKEGMKLLAEQMRENDRVAIVVYAQAQGLALPSTSGANREQIIAAIDELQAGGSTNGGAGIELAYKIAGDNLIRGGVNRVILCTDGDFNVGTTSTGDLVRMVEERARSGVFLSVLGFGRGNLNDAMVEQLSNKGNGNYTYIDSINEARKVLVEQMGGTLVTIAKDVKIQIEFNPAQVAAYRLIGYENRILAAEDFNDDKKDAGEIGAGHTVTALYEIVPAGTEIDVPSVDPLKYQPAAAPALTENPAADATVSDVQPTFSNELLTLKLRYKEPEGDTSRLLTFPFVDKGESFAQAGADMQFASAVASFGMLLRGSQFKGDTTYGAVLEVAESAKGLDPHGYRAEFIEMVRRAKAIAER